MRVSHIAHFPDPDGLLPECGRRSRSVASADHLYVRAATQTWLRAQGHTPRYRYIDRKEAPVQPLVEIDVGGHTLLVHMDRTTPPDWDATGASDIILGPGVPIDHHTLSRHGYVNRVRFGNEGIRRVMMLGTELPHMGTDWRFDLTDCTVDEHGRLITPVITRHRAERAASKWARVPQPRGNNKPVPQPRGNNKPVPQPRGRNKETQGKVPIGALTRVRRIEHAKTSLDAGQIGTVLDVYRAGPGGPGGHHRRAGAGQRPRLVAPLRGYPPCLAARAPGVASAATPIRTWHPLLVPELLQTRAYARALEAEPCPGTDPQEADRRVDLRAERQQRLRGRGTLIWALIPTAALHTHVGGETVMADQRAHVRKMMKAGLAAQILPPDHPPTHLVTCPPLTLLRVAAPEVPDHLLRLHSITGAALVTSNHTVATYRGMPDTVTARLPSTTHTTLPTHPKER